MTLSAIKPTSHARLKMKGAAKDAEMNYSKDFTPRPRPWSTARWDALNIEFSNQ
jgi:hypothetical protein